MSGSLRVARALVCLAVISSVAACGDDDSMSDSDGSMSDATTRDADASTTDASGDASTLPNGGLRPPPAGDPAPPSGPPPGTPAETPTGIYYDIVYVRMPRFGDDTRVDMPEVKDPINIEAGSDLMLLHPDGSEEVLVAGGDGAVTDPYVSFDGRSVYYAYFPDVTDFNYQRRDAPRAGSDIYRMELATREITRLTHQEWTPNTAAGNWASDHLSTDSATNSLRYGIFNLGPCPLPGGRVMFTSSRNGFLPNASFTFPNLQLFVMDEDGENVEMVGHINLGSALHPTILTDGRVMFSSYEAQGVRDVRVWGLWAIRPDGRVWEPLMSAFSAPTAFHFQTQLSDGHIVVEEYYNQNNNGFGSFLRFPAWRSPDEPAFGNPDPRHPSNPELPGGWYNNGNQRITRHAFSPQGLQTLTEFANGGDSASELDPDTGAYMGKVTQPSAAPHNELLLVWTPGPANNLSRPTPLPYYDAGLYIMDGGSAVDRPEQLREILNRPEYNEMWPRAVVPYVDVYGIEEPFQLGWLPNAGDRHELLPEGTPYGLVGASSFYKRDSFPAIGEDSFDGLDPFNTSENGASSNWVTQGSDSGRYDDSEIHAVRLVAMEPNSHRSYGPGNNAGGNVAFRSHANERLRVLGEWPLRNVDDDGAPILDPEGDPDTSFLALVPGDTPFTFQTLDENGLVLNASQTWHTVRPGEVRVDCGGCHSHSQTPLAFEDTFAATDAYRIPDFANQTPMLTRVDGEPAIRVEDVGATDVEFHRDIKPILERSCVSCHNSAGRADGNLILDDDELVDDFDGTWNRLANDQRARWGIPPIIHNGTWRQTNASRYVRMFQSRRSLLAWKVFGRRLDGWTNEDHPTESTPGDVSTLPEGATANEADIDYVGEIMPPPGSDVPPLSEDEKMLFARWIDLGCPITPANDEERAGYGWFLDELRPTLSISSPATRRVAEPIDVIRFGAFDYYSGLDEDSMSVAADFMVNGRAAGAELSDLFDRDDGVWTLTLDAPIADEEERTLVVRVRDNAGNWSEVTRVFRVVE